MSEEARQAWVLSYLPVPTIGRDRRPSISLPQPSHTGWGMFHGMLRIKAGARLRLSATDPLSTKDAAAMGRKRVAVVDVPKIEAR